MVFKSTGLIHMYLNNLVFAIIVMSVTSHSNAMNRIKSLTAIDIHSVTYDTCTFNVEK